MSTETPASERTKEGDSFAETALKLGGKRPVDETAADGSHRYGRRSGRIAVRRCNIKRSTARSTAPFGTVVCPWTSSWKCAPKDAAGCATGNGRFSGSRPAAQIGGHIVKQRRQNCRVRACRSGTRRLLGRSSTPRSPRWPVQPELVHNSSKSSPLPPVKSSMTFRRSMRRWPPRPSANTVFTKSHYGQVCLQFRAD